MSMRMCVLGVALVAAVAFTDGPPVRSDDKVVGAIWEIKFEADNPKDVVVRKFRATQDGKVWNVPVKEKPRVIGKWTGDESEATMEIDAKGNGGARYEIVQVGKNPPRWRGTAVRAEDGKRTPVKVRLLRD
jgi:hypothetical protein